MLEQALSFNWYQMEDILIPILFGLVLPIVIMALVMSSKKHAEDMKTQRYIAALEKGIDPKDIEGVKEIKKETQKVEKNNALASFRRGCIIGLVGLAFLVLGLCTNMLGFDIPGGILLAVGAGNVISFFVGKKYKLDE